MRLLAVALVLAGAALGCSGCCRLPTAAEIHADLEARAALEGTVDLPAFARALASRLRGRVEVVPVPRVGGSAHTMTHPRSIAFVRVETYESLRGLKPLRALYWLPAPPSRQLVLAVDSARPLTGVADLVERSGLAPTRSVDMAWRLASALGLDLTLLTGVDVHHARLPPAPPGDLRRFRWTGLLTQALLERRTDYVIAEGARLAAESTPEQRRRLRVLARLDAPSDFVLVTLGSAESAFLEAIAGSLPPRIASTWRLSGHPGADAVAQLPEVLARSIRRVSEPIESSLTGSRPAVAPSREGESPTHRERARTRP